MSGLSALTTSAEEKVLAAENPLELQPSAIQAASRTTTGPPQAPNNPKEPLLGDNTTVTSSSKPTRPETTLQAAPQFPTGQPIQSTSEPFASVLPTSSASRVQAVPPTIKAGTVASRVQAFASLGTSQNARPRSSTTSQGRQESRGEAGQEGRQKRGGEAGQEGSEKARGEAGQEGREKSGQEGPEKARPEGQQQGPWKDGQRGWLRPEVPPHVGNYKSSMRALGDQDAPQASYQISTDPPCYLTRRMWQGNLSKDLGMDVDAQRKWTMKQPTQGNSSASQGKTLGDAYGRKLNRKYLCPHHAAIQSAKMPVNTLFTHASPKYRQDIVSDSAWAVIGRYEEAQAYSGGEGQCEMCKAERSLLSNNSALRANTTQMINDVSATDFVPESALAAAPLKVTEQIPERSEKPFANEANSNAVDTSQDSQNQPQQRQQIDNKSSAPARDGNVAPGSFPDSMRSSRTNSESSITRPAQMPVSAQDAQHS